MTENTISAWMAPKKPVDNSENVTHLLKFVLAKMLNAKISGYTVFVDNLHFRIDGSIKQMCSKPVQERGYVY